jgi:hypothetical protein
LPEDCRPATLEEAFAIEEATVVQLGDRIAGWKVARFPDGQFAYGIILGSRVLRSGGVVGFARRPAPRLRGRDRVSIPAGRTGARSGVLVRGDLRNASSRFR